MVSTNFFIIGFKIFSESLTSASLDESNILKISKFKFLNSISESKIDFSKFNYYGKELPAMTAGIFGYMGYDMVRLTEDLPNNNLNDNLLIPDSIFIRPQILLIFDNFYDCLLICAPNFKNHEDYDHLQQKIINVEKIINEPLILDQQGLNKDFKGFNFIANY